MDRHNLRTVLAKLNVQIDEGQSTDTKIVGFCPFAPYRHKKKTDTRPSFAAFVNDGISGYLCMACQSKGTIRRLAYDLGNLRGADYSELQLIIDEAEAGADQLTYEHIYSPPPPLEPLQEAAYDGIYPKASKVLRGVFYLAKRGISTTTANRINLLFDPDQNRVLFEIRDYERNLYGFTGRSIHSMTNIKVKDYHGLKKKRLILGQEYWERGKPLFIVEGLFAYAHLHHLYPNREINVGALMGAHLNKEQADRIKEFSEATYLLLDNDEAGEDGTFGYENRPHDFGAVGELCGHLPLYVPAWPEGKDDPDQLTREEVDYMLETSDLFTDIHLEELKRQKRANFN